MKILNREKSNQKIVIRNDLNNIITQLTHEQEQIKETLNQINLVSAGTPSGKDREVLNNLHLSLEKISLAIQSLRTAANSAAQFDVMEEVPDDKY